MSEDTKGLDIDDIKSELRGTGIAVRTPEDVKEDNLPPGLAVVIGPSSPELMVVFKRNKVSRILQTTGETGDQIWQSADVERYVSKDLHRVVFHIAALHPPFE